MRRLPILLQLLCGSLASLLAALYALSRLATDRTHATQYLFWTPWAAYALAIAMLLLPAFLLARRARRRSRPVRAWAWRLPALALALIIAHVLLADWHFWRFLFRPAQAPPERTLRLMHWNMTYAAPNQWDRFILALQQAPHADVLIVTNPTLANQLSLLAAALGPGYSAARVGTFAVVSRLPILDTGFASLEIPPFAGGTALPPGMGRGEGGEEQPETDYLPDWSPIPRTGSNVYDPGHAMFVRVDAHASLGRSLVIWGIDMPSEPRAWRMNFATAAARRLQTLVTAGPPASNVRNRFPEPDLIAGDCNTPRGSASLAVLARGYTEAFDQAGRGHVGTWPRGFAWFHLDHVFVSPDLRATRYRVLNLGLSEHLAQIADITTR